LRGAWLAGPSLTEDLVFIDCPPIVRAWSRRSQLLASNAIHVRTTGSRLQTNLAALLVVLVSALFGLTGHAQAQQVTPNVVQIGGSIIPQVTPKGTSVTAVVGANSYAFTLKNIGTSSGGIDVSWSCSGAAISCSAGGASYFLRAGETRSVTVSYTGASSGGSGTVYLNATNDLGDHTDYGYISATVPPPPPTYNVSVSSGSVAVEPGSWTYQFTVTNNGNTQATYTLTPSCSAMFATCSAPASVTVAPNGGTAPVTASYSATTRGATGTFTLTASYGGYSASGTLNVSVNNSYGVSVSPHSGSQQILPGTTTANVDFVVTNTGSSTVTYSFTPHCGQLDNGGCSTNLPSYQLASGASVGVTVAADATQLGSSSPVTLDADDFTHGSHDAGTVNVTTATYTVAVSPVVTELWAEHNDSSTASFSIYNGGTAPSATYSLSWNCSASEITGGNGVTGCHGPTSVTVARNATQTVVGTYTTAQPGDSGYVRLTASAAGTSDVDSAKVRIYDRSVAVTPDAQTLPPMEPGSYSQQFIIRNNGNVGTTYALSATCSQVATSCSPATGSLFVNAKTQGTFNVGYSALTRGQSGQVTLTATAGSFSDVGSINVQVSNSYSVSVTPDAGAAPPVDGGSQGNATFVVRNTGTGGTSYNLTPSCSGVSTPCDATPFQLSLAGGDTGIVNVSFTNGSPNTTGRIALTATDASRPTKTDSGWVSTSVKTYTVDVSSSTTSVNYEPGAPASQIFTITNNGNADAQYTLTATCSRAATNCPLVRTLTVQHGLSAPDTVRYVVSTTAGDTGYVRLKATAGTFSSATVDSQLVKLTVNSHTVAVSPKSGGVTVYAGTHTQSYSVTNNGNVPSDFEVRAGCTLAIYICSASPETITNLGVKASKSVTVSYTTTDAGGTGDLTLIANSVLNPAVRDSGKLSMTVKPTYTVTLTPASSTVYGEGDTATVNFSAINTGSASATYALVTACTGLGAPTGCAADSTVTIARGATDTVRVKIALGAPGTTATVNLSATATSDNSFASSASANLVVLKYAVAVVPQVASATVAAYAAETRSFTVTNTGNTTRVFDFQAQCALPVASNCLASPASQSLAPSVSVPVNVSYTTGDPEATGIIRLVAMDTGSKALGDSSMAITVGAAIANSRIIVNELNPGTTIERSQCVIIAIVRDVADECGALRIVHPLPAVRTLGMARVPTLLYSSDQVQAPMLPINVILADTATIPTRIKVQVTRTWMGGAQDIDTISFAGSEWSSSRRRRITIPVVGALSHNSGFVHYAVEVRGSYSSGSPVLGTASGNLAFVNRTNSPFGGGWWLAGLEQITAQSDSVFWVGGDGSTRLYINRHTLAGTDTVYLADAFTAPDTLLHRADGLFQRQAGNGLVVEFDALGYHHRTVNRHGYITTFNYDANHHLSSIQLPPWQGATPAHQYVFVANASSGLLDSVIAPSIGGKRRNVVFVRNGSMRGVQAINEHLGDSTFQVSFGIPSDREMEYSWRTDRRNVRTWFRSDAKSPTMSSFATPTGIGTDSVIHRFRSPSLVAADGMSQPVDSVYLLYDGPRPDSVGDVTKFWLDRFGAPVRVVNALGQGTRLEHGDIRFPGLVTESRLNNGFTSWAAYDARGNLLSSTQVDPHDDGNDATTTYRWDAKWNMVTRIVQPEGETLELSYADSTGDRVWQQDARGLSSRANFTYQGGFLTSVQAPGATCNATTKRGCDFFAADAMGNLQTAFDPAGGETRFERDAIGRVTVTRHQITPGNTTLWQDDSVSYDLADRVSREVKYGPAVRTGDTPSKVIVAHLRDASGADTLVKRWSEPDPASVGVIETRWAFDSLGRVLTETGPDGVSETMQHDLAGNVVHRLTRNGKTIDYEYDPLGRLVKDSFPEVRYDARYVGLGNISFTDGILRPYPWYFTAADSSMTVEGDVETFAYDDVGNMTRADNGSAFVRRGYYPNGSLRADTSIVRTFDTRDSTQHVYTTGYRYDANGRLLALTLPSQLSPSATGTYRDSITYAYDGLGQLASVTEPLGTSFGFTYDLKGERIRLALPGGLRDSSIYDDAGRVTRSLVYNPVQGRDPYPGAVLRDQTFTYDAAGRMLSRQNVSGLANSDTSWYAGLGHLVRYAYHQPVANAFQQPGVVQDVERFTLDAMGNRYLSRDTTNLDATGHTANQVTGVTYSYADPTSARTGRLRAVDHALFNDSLLYDPAGNEVMSYTWHAAPIQSVNAQRSDHASFYGSDGRLRASEWRYTPVAYLSDPEGWPFTVTAEDYRYDALGRRVLVRTRKTCRNDHLGYNNPCSAGALRRTIWSGDQVLGEIQMPVGPRFSTSWMELDTVHVALDIFTHPTYFDADPLYGRVVYTHAGGVDQPLAITRMGYTDNYNDSGRVAMPSFTIVPHWDSRGQADMGTMTDGGTKFCDPVQTSRCAEVYWRQRSFAFVQSGPDPSSVAWHGTLKDDARDASGMLYRRNRYVNPETGRFTQEDPIGLGGGVNVYGFAEGDPVNYADPLGLCPPCYPGMPGMRPLNDGSPGKGLAILAGVTVGAAASLAAPEIAGAAMRWLAGSSTAIPTLTVPAIPKGREMLGQAVQYLQKMPASARVDAFRNFAQQIEAATQGGWQALEQQAVNATVFSGKAGEAIVFDAQGQAFRGTIGNPSQFVNTAKGMVVNFDKLRQIIH
jgi:RHS repeat-associated protein